MNHITLIEFDAEMAKELHESEKGIKHFLARFHANAHDALCLSSIAFQAVALRDQYLSIQNWRKSGDADWRKKIQELENLAMMPPAFNASPPDFMMGVARKQAWLLLWQLMRRVVRE